MIYFFRIIKVYQCFFTLNILFDEVGRGLGHEKKNLLYTIYTGRVSQLGWTSGGDFLGKIAKNSIKMFWAKQWEGT